MLFTAIYYIFSHNVHSNYLTFAFLYPLIFGIFWELFFKKYDYLPKEIYNAGGITLVLSCLLQGIHDIAGPQSEYIQPMFFLGALITIFYIIVYTVIYFLRKNK